MKITIVNGFFLPIPPVGGGAFEKVWYRLAKELAGKGHEVTFISRKWPRFADDEVVDGIRFLRIKGFDHTRRLWLNLVLDFIWCVRAGRALPTADVTVCNNIALPVWAKRLHPRAGKIVVTIGRMPKGQTKLYGGVDLVLSLSAALTGAIRRENPSIAGKIRPFPLPVENRLLEAKPREASPIRPLRIGYIGRLNPEKGIDVLLAALSDLAAQPGLPEWSAVLVGPTTIPSGGGGQEWLDAVIASRAGNARGRLTVKPPIFDPELLAAEYGAIDIFVYPSLAEKGETFGLAVAEAMASGCVPVVSRLECFSDLVDDGRDGVYFDHRAPNRETLLKNALAALLVDNGKRQELGHAAKQRAKNLSLTTMADRLVDIFGSA